MQDLSIVHVDLAVCLQLVSKRCWKQRREYGSARNQMFNATELPYRSNDIKKTSLFRLPFLSQKNILPTSQKHDFNISVWTPVTDERDI